MLLGVEAFPGNTNGVTSTEQVWASRLYLLYRPLLEPASLLVEL